MTNRIPGERLPGSSSSAIEAPARLDWARVALLFFAGGAAVALHAGTRGHMHLPGHQGLIWMALLGVVRSATAARWGASIAGLGGGAAAALPLFGFHDPLTVAGYVLSAFAFDALANVAPTTPFPGLRAGTLAAAAFATKPVLQWLATIGLGWHTPVATHGLAYPLATHLAFGFAGGVIGTWLWQRFAGTRRP